MCGIGGLISKNQHKGKAKIDSDLRRMGQLLSHRGPNGEGRFVHIGATSVGLVHRRLSIIDPAGGGQPLTDPNGRYTLVFNGEIYNFVEIRTQLEGLGHSFKTQSDTEVLLTAYRQWGEQCQDLFNGMWAFAIWDDFERSLFLSRDRFGVKPLYFARFIDNFAFSSELKGFAAFSDFKIELDESAAIAVLRDVNCLESTDKTIYKNIFRLPAGHSLSYRNNEITVKKWWRTVDHLNSESLTLKQATKKFRELFYDACRLRLRSDVPVATALSGGLDSSAVTGVLSVVRTEDVARKAPSSHQAFVATYPGTYQDEGPYAHLMAQKAGAQVHEIEIGPEQTEECLEKVLWNAEEPYDLAIVGPWLLYQNMRANNVTVSLDGHGGDELLAGYHRHVQFQAQVCARKPWRWPEMKEHLKLLKLMFERRPAAAPSFNRMAAKGLLRQPTILEEALPGVTAFKEMAQMPESDLLNRLLYYDFHHQTLPPILRNFDRLSMAHGVEVREPFLDYRLVTFLFSLPSSFKLAQGQTKFLLRQALKGELPETIRRRPGKIGFSSPADQWVQTSFRNYFLDQISSQAFLQSPIWDGPSLRNQANSCIQEGRWDEFAGFWPMIQLLLFVQRFQQEQNQSRVSIPTLDESTTRGALL